MIDYSFLRFTNTIEDIEPSIVDIRYYGQVHLIPNEFYCQITNTLKGITFAGNYEAYLVNSCGDELEEITDKVRIYEFTDINGVNQIAFEFYLTADYGLNPIYIKLRHTESYEEFYSSPFVCSETQREQTSLFTYRHYGFFKGISYDKYENYQNIRLNLYFDYPENKTEVGEYYQIIKERTIANRALYNQSEKYSCELMNAFYFERVNIMLIHDVVYVDGERISNKPQLTNEERQLDSNFFAASFDCFKDRNDNLYFEPSMFTFEAISFSPTGIYTSIAPSTATISFSDYVVDNGNTVIEMRYYSNDILILTRNSSQLTIVNNTITFDIGGLYQNSKYYFLISKNTLQSPHGQKYQGIENKDVWTFVRKNGDYKSGDYDSDDYSIKM